MFSDPERRHETEITIQRLKQVFIFLQCGLLAMAAVLSGQVTINWCQIKKHKLTKTYFKNVNYTMIKTHNTNAKVLQHSTYIFPTPSSQSNCIHHLTKEEDILNKLACIDKDQFIILALMVHAFNYNTLLPDCIKSITSKEVFK